MVGKEPGPLAVIKVMAKDSMEWGVVNGECGDEGFHKAYSGGNYPGAGCNRLDIAR